MFNRVFALLAVFVVAFPSGALASGISATLNDQSLQWQLDNHDGQVQLTLVGPDGSVNTKAFVAGDSPTVDLSSFVAMPGLYSYEITILPIVTAEERAQLQAARLAGEVLDLGLEVIRHQGSFRNHEGDWVIGSSMVAETGGELPGDADGEIIDQTFTEDIQIQGSLCVGFDCPTAPSFGSDTVRLQENNLRIHFDDTSASANFANRDWRIIINGQNNGDPEYFAIQDATANRIPFQIEGNAPADSLHVDDGGRIGFGTPTPVAQLHVRDGNTPTLRLEQDGSSGFQAQIWDVAGNETNFFVRDATNGSQLPFKIRPGAASDSLYIDSNNDVGISTPNPAARLHVAGGDLRVDGAVYQLSSRSAKTDLVAMSADHLLGLLAELDLFNWRYQSASPDDRHFGPTSEDFYAAFGLGSSEQHISVADMAGVALGAAQALQQELAERDEQLDTMAQRMAEMEAMIEALQADRR
ncbi:MAG: hypothetical protein AAGJ52_02590 [Pseudomonadota bacterium]